jgi:type I restriction-modification system DNA methylase subunit
MIAHHPLELSIHDRSKDSPFKMTVPSPSHLNKPKLNNLADEIWKSAERLRGKFKAHDYQNVILPIITIRRLECVLIKWREDKAEEIRSKRKSIPDAESRGLSIYQSSRANEALRGTCSYAPPGVNTQP